LDFDKEDDAWIEEDDEEMENNSNSNKIEQHPQGITNNSFNDEHENNLDTFIELKKSNGAKTSVF
jgi:hypothetical protein